MSNDFFGDADTAIDVKVRVIKENNTDSIINQYIIFCKVYNEQMKLYGRTRKTIMETIRICKDRNVLKEYLESREKEVVSIMMSLFDEEEIIRSYIKSERYEAAQEAAQEAKLENSKKTAVELIKLGIMSLDTIAKVTDLPLDIVRELKSKNIQLA